MKFVGHLVRWDLRRLRAPLALWTVLVAAYTVVVAMRPYAAADLSTRESVGVVDSLLWLTLVLLTLALVSLVVHEHPTVGTDAFWMTRAIPPDSLLASKLGVLALAVLAVPAVAESVLLAVNRMPVAAALGVLTQATALRVVLLILLVVGAVMTPNLPRFALLCGAAVLGAAAAIGVTTSLLMRRIEGFPPVDTGTRTVEDPSAALVFNTLLVAAEIVVLALQYRTRLKRRSLLAGAIAVAVAILVAWLWPVPFLRHRLELPEWANRATLNVDAASLFTHTQHGFFAAGANEWSTVRGRIRVDGLQPGWSASLTFRDASVQLPNGSSIRAPIAWRSNTVVLEAYGGREAYATIQELLGVQTLGNLRPQTEPPRPETLPVLFVARRPEVAALLPARGRYATSLDVNFTHFVALGAIPVRAGATHQSGAYRLSIDNIGLFDGRPSLTAREARATSMWERRPWALYHFYLRNTGRSQAVALTDHSLQQFFSLIRLLPIGEFSIGGTQASGFSSRGLLLSLPPRSYPDDAMTFEVDENWLRDADLVIVRQTEEGWVERTLEIPGFPIDP